MKNEIVNLNKELPKITSIFDKVQEGMTHKNISGPESQVFIKLLKEGIKQIESQSKALTENDLSDSVDNKISVNGYEIATKNTGSTYDFTNCDRWVRMYKELKQFEKQLKAGGMFDPETGEMYPDPIKKPKASSITVTKIKQ